METKSIKSWFKRVTGIDAYLRWQRIESEKIKSLQGKILANQIKAVKNINSFEEIEFSVFSQWGDDGIIQYLIYILGINNKTFIEFGVENYLESNTRFLLINNNWKGLVIDGSERNIQFIKQDDISWRYDLDSVCAFITKENLNDIVKRAKFEGEIGILHIDVDGNDYWFWECLTGIDPEIVIMEYNSAFGMSAAITVPYRDDFQVSKAHYSRLYFGASLRALNYLATQKGYALVGCNSNGNNAYFVRKDKLTNIRPLSVEEAYVACKFRQNRNINGDLTFLSDIDMINICGEMEIYDVENNKIVQLKQALK